MEVENSNLTSRFKQLEDQANKYFHLKLQKDVMDKKISNLQVEMIQKQRCIRKLKSKTARYHKEMLDKSSFLKKMEHHLKKVWSFLLVLGNKLRRNDLLTVEEKDKLRIEYEEWFTLLVSQDKRKTEEVFNMLNNLPISLFQVLNDSDYSSEKCPSNLNRVHFNKKQNILPNTDKVFSSGKQNNNPSLECDANNSFVASTQLSTGELSNEHNTNTSSSDSDGDIFDSESCELSAGISNNHYNKRHVKSIFNKPFKGASDQNNLDLSCNLEDLFDAEPWEAIEPELTVNTLLVSNQQDISENVGIPPNNLQTDSTSSQMSVVENCSLDTANVNISYSNSSSNLNRSSFICKKNSIGSKNIMDDSKCGSTNSQFSPNEISSESVQDSKMSKKRVTPQSKKLFRKEDCDNYCESIFVSKTSSSLQKDNSLDNNFELKVNSLLQNGSVVKDPTKIKQTTIMLPRPTVKISRKRRASSAEKEDLESKEMPYTIKKNYSPVKRAQQSSSPSLQPKKKTQALLSDVAPVRVRGRTLLNRGTFKKNIEIDVANECDEECNKSLKGQSETNQDKSMSEFNFVSTCKPKKVRKEHKGNFENKKSVNEAELIRKENETSNANETETNFHKNVSENLENTNKNIVNDLLKEAEISNIKIDLKRQSLILARQLKLKANRNHTVTSNISKQAVFKKGKTRFQNQKSKAIRSNIKKYNRTDKMQALKTENESTCNVNNDFDQAKSHASNTMEIETDIALLNIQEELSEVTVHKLSEKEDSDTTNSESFTLMVENKILGSEVHLSNKKVDVSPIERKSMLCAMKCDSENTNNIVTAKDLDKSKKNFNSNENCISENDSDFEGNLVIDNKLNSGERKISNESHTCLPEKMDVDYFPEDSDSESPLVIDENFGVEQCVASKEDHHKHKNQICKNEYNNYLNCINVDVSGNIQEHNPLVCTQNASHFNNSHETSTANTVTNKEDANSKANVKNKFISSQNISFAQSLTPVKVDVGKPQIEKRLNKQKSESPACQEIGLTPEIKDKSAQKKIFSTRLDSSKWNKYAKIKRKLAKDNLKMSQKNYHNIIKSIPEKFFEEFQSIEFSVENFKQNSKKLFNFLINPSHFPNNSALLFQVVNYLQNSKKNPLLGKSANGDFSVLFPLDESCIVATLFLIESKKKHHLDGLLETSVTTIQHIISSNKKFGIYGLASLCRVFTAICREKGDRLKPVKVCVDLLKMKHAFAPYLIASVAGVWKELFQVDSDTPAEESLLHSCILHGASTKTKRLVDENYKSSIEFLSKYFTAVPVNNPRAAIHMLKDLINVRCEDDTWDNQYLASAIIILAAFENLDWTKEKLLTEFIIPNLNKHGRETLNENAFDFFCNLYVETLLLDPHNPLDTVLRDFIEHPTNQDANFVRDSAALALVKFVYKKNRKLPSFLSAWLELNKENPKVKRVELSYEISMFESLSVLQEENIPHK